jgi:hypothetical protein
MRIVHDQRYRATLGRTADKLMRSQRHQEWIRLEVAPDTERGVERAALRAWQELGVRHDRSEELMHAGEGEHRLGLHADGGQHLRADFTRACARVLEQRRLSNACLAADHQCPTPIVDTIDKGTDVIRLGATPYQLSAQA